MDTLREILRVVTSKGDRSRLVPELEGLSESEGADSLTSKFIRGLHDDLWADDEEAALALYGSDTGDQRYRTLKSRVFERLLHSLLFLQVKQPEHSEYLAYQYKCTRNLLCAQTLTRFSSRNAGYTIAMKTLTIAQRYQFTELSLSLSSMLRETSALWMNKREFRHYNVLVNKYLGNLEAEHRSSELLDSLALESSISSRKRSYLVSFAERTVQQMDELLLKHDTHLLKLNSFRIRLTYLQLIEDYEKTIVLCDSATEYLNAHPHLSQRARFGEFLISKMVCCIYARRFLEAQQMSHKCISYFTPGGSNWYLAVDLAFVASINVGDFEGALEYYLLATQHEQFRKHKEPAVRERWILYYAYLLLGKRLGMFESELIQSKLFRLPTYLNSLPEESKNKLVFNVLILISQVYFLILDGQYDGVDKRVEYLKVYTSRWLKEREFLRVRIFLKMLYNFSRFSYDAKSIRIGNAELAVQLQQSGHEPMPTETNELIPFEMMYERILDHLGKNRVAIEA